MALWWSTIQCHRGKTSAVSLGLLIHGTIFPASSAQCQIMPYSKKQLTPCPTLQTSVIMFNIKVLDSAIMKKKLTLAASKSSTEWPKRKESISCKDLVKVQLWLWLKYCGRILGELCKKPKTNKYLWVSMNSSNVIKKSGSTVPSQQCERLITSHRKWFLSPLLLLMGSIQDHGVYLVFPFTASLFSFSFGWINSNKIIMIITICHNHLYSSTAKVVLLLILRHYKDQINFLYSGVCWIIVGNWY